MSETLRACAEWRQVPGYEGIYEVSNYGEVRSLDRLNTRGHRIKGKTLRPCTSEGYAKVNLYSAAGVKTHVQVHRIVMRTFVGPCPDGMEVLHGGWRWNQ